MPFESLEFIKQFVLRQTLDNPRLQALVESTDCIDRAALVVSLLHGANIEKENIIIYSIQDNPKILSHNFKHVWIEVRTGQLNKDGTPVMFDMDVMNEMTSKYNNLTYGEMKVLAKAGDSEFPLQINFSSNLHQKNPALELVQG